MIGPVYKIEDRTHCLCKCSCGNEKPIRTSDLKPDMKRCMKCKTIKHISLPIGYRSNNITVIGEWFWNKHHQRTYPCKCDCGNLLDADYSKLHRHKIKKCWPCSIKDVHKLNSQKVIDAFLGKKIYKWYVFDVVSAHDNVPTLFKVRCECGTETQLPSAQLQKGRSKQCLKCCWKNRIIHGREGKTEYRIWDGMRRRCQSPNNKDYPRYGGRGITVCERWQKFSNFFEDMGLRPEGMQLDRIDNDGNYEPGNVKWASPKENSNNRRPRSEWKTK